MWRSIRHLSTSRGYTDLPLKTTLRGENREALGFFGCMLWQRQIALCRKPHQTYLILVISSRVSNDNGTEAKEGRWIGKPLATRRRRGSAFFQLQHPSERKGVEEYRQHYHYYDSREFNSLEAERSPSESHEASSHWWTRSQLLSPSFCNTKAFRISFEFIPIKRSILLITKYTCK